VSSPWDEIKLEFHLDWSPLEVEFKLSDLYPRPFMGDPTGNLEHTGRLRLFSDNIDSENTASSVAISDRHSFLGGQRPLKIQKRKATDQITK